MAPQNIVRLGLAVAGGVCLDLAFPNWGVAGLGWIGPGLLLAAGLGCRPGRAFGFGFIGGFVFNLTSLSWFLSIPDPAGSVAAWIGLGLYCSLYSALWVWLAVRALPPVVVAIRYPDLALIGRLSWSQRVSWSLFCAASWVGLEMVRGRFLTGFPWNFLGTSQFKMLPVIQVAAWTGVYGVSFLMVWFSASLLCAVATLAVNASKVRPWAGDMILPLLTVSVVTAAGFDRMAGGARREGENSADRGLKIALVQPSIPQTLIWSTAGEAARFEKLVAMSATALAGHPDVLVWPEGVMPPWTLQNFNAVTNIAATHKVWLILQADDGDQTAAGSKSYNAAFLFAPDGRFITTYRKRRLVIFGEYIPLVQWFPFIKHFTPIEGGYSAGERPGEFLLNGPTARLGIFICFEDVFPDSTREFVKPGTDILVNLTNDGWFGEGSEQWQHAAMGIFRAVENGVTVVRATNNGVTCWVDPWGRVREFLAPEGSIYKAGIFEVEVPLLKPGARTPTFYNLHGDLFGWICLAASAAAVVLGGQRRRSDGTASLLPPLPAVDESA